MRYACHTVGMTTPIWVFPDAQTLAAEKSAGAGDPYTGIFRSGAQCVIGRFSMANKLTLERSVPARALKIFIDGNRPSVNRCRAPDTLRLNGDLLEQSFF